MEPTLKIFKPYFISLRFSKSVQQNRLYIITNSVVWFGSIFETPFSRCMGQTDIKTLKDYDIWALKYVHYYFILID